jgi:undecaprenyl-diphosphatase
LSLDCAAVDWLQIIILALVQGITEFLPISSSAHLILPALLTEWPDQGLAFDVAVHAGTLLAVLSYFRREIGRFASSGTRMLVGGHRDDDADLLLKLIAATLPIVVVGYLAHDWVEANLRTVPVIASATIVFAIALWWADGRRGGADHPSWWAAMLIGTAQVIAIVPGTSRSGITITAALLLGLSRTSAARFSFLLSIPTILGASVLEVAALGASEHAVRWGELLTGAALAGAGAYCCIHFFVKLVERTGMLPYVVYRLMLGALLLGLAL